MIIFLWIQAHVFTYTISRKLCMFSIGQLRTSLCLCWKTRNNISTNYMSLSATSEHEQEKMKWAKFRFLLLRKKTKPFYCQNQNKSIIKWKLLICINELYLSFIRIERRNLIKKTTSKSHQWYFYIFSQDLFTEKNLEAFVALP